MYYPRLRYVNREGFQVTSDSVVMCFYLQHANERIASGVMRALDLFRERVSPYQFEWNVDHEGQSHRMNDAEWGSIHRQILTPEPDTSVVIRLMGGPGRVEGLYVDYRGLRCYPLPWPGRERDVSALFMRFPTELLEAQGANGVREWVRDLADALPFVSGYVNLALIGSGMDGEAADLVRTRYPGLHMTGDGPDIRMGARVDGIHWMNFLGQPILGELGGVAGLREHLNLSGISIQEMSGDRVLITLGEQPETEDVEAGQTLPLHRALARLLEPHLYHRTVPLGRMSPEDMRRWERRFLD